MTDQAATGATMPLKQGFSIPDVRHDLWAQLAVVASAWAAAAGRGENAGEVRGGSAGRARRTGAARGVQRLSRAAAHARCSARAWRRATPPASPTRPGASPPRCPPARSATTWPSGSPRDEGEAQVADYLPPTAEADEKHRPYFEVLSVTAADPSRYEQLRHDIRRLRRVDDPFVYELVQAGSFEDAIVAVLANPELQAVVIGDGFGFRSQREWPELRDLLDRAMPFDPDAVDVRDYGLKLAWALKRIRPELDVYLLTERGAEAHRRPARGRVAAPDLLRRRGADGAPPLDPRRRRRPLRHPLFHEPQALQPEAGGHLPRPAGGAGQVRVPFQVDPGHGPLLRHQPLPRGVVRHDGRAGQPPGADRQHQARPGDGGAGLRRGPGLLRHQRHVHVQQDRPAGAAGARRHRADRPQLPQVAPLRHGALRRPAAVPRGLPDDGLLDVRRGAAPVHQEGAAGPQGRGQAGPGEAGGPHQLHLRRPHVQPRARHGGVPGHQAGPGVPLGRGLVRLRALLAVPPAAHVHARRRQPGRAPAHAGVPEGVRRVPGPGRATWTRRTRTCSTCACCRTPTR